jgi:hypothetical protein
VLVAAGPEVAVGALARPAELIDLGPTAMAALGVTSSIARDGRVLNELVGAEMELRVDEGATGTSRGADDTGLTSEEEGEIEEHLRGLGYVE